MISKKIIAHYQKMVFWAHKLDMATTCWRAADIGIEYTTEERQLLNEADAHFNAAKNIVNKIYSKRIGEAVTEDIRIGEYK